MASVHTTAHPLGFGGIMADADRYAIVFLGAILLVQVVALVWLSGRGVRRVSSMVWARAIGIGTFSAYVIGSSLARLDKPVTWLLPAANVAVLAGIFDIGKQLGQLRHRPVLVVPTAAPAHISEEELANRHRWQLIRALIAAFIALALAAIFTVGYVRYSIDSSNRKWCVALARINQAFTSGQTNPRAAPLAASFRDLSHQFECPSGGDNGKVTLPVSPSATPTR